MKSYSKKSGKSKYNSFKGKQKSNLNPKSFNKKWHHDKYSEKEDQADSNDAQPRNSFVPKERRKHISQIGKSPGKKLTFESVDKLLILFDNEDKEDTSNRVNQYLGLLDLKFPDKTFLLFKIRIYYEMRERRMKCFDESEYQQLLETCEQYFQFHD